MRMLNQTLSWCRRVGLRSFLFSVALVSPLLCFGMSGDVTASGSGTEASCVSITEPDIQSKLATLENRYSVVLSDYECVIVDFDAAIDVSEIINNQAPSSIIIFRQSSPNTSFSAKTVARLKPDSWLVGVNTTGDEPVTVKMADDFEFNGTHWLETGASALFRDIGNSGVSGLQLVAPADGTDQHVDSIIFLQCFNGSFTIANNDFFLDRRSSVFYWCLKSSGVNESRFVFQQNKVHGLNLNPGLENNPDRGNTRSLEGLFVEAPFVRNNRDAVVVTGNEFSGNYLAAMKLTVGESSQARVANNTANSSSVGAVQAGIQLHLRGKGEKAYYIVDGNELNAESGLQLYGGMDIEITNNRLVGREAVEQKKQILDLSGKQAQNYGLVNIVDGLDNEFLGDGSAFFGLKRYQGMLQFNGLTMAGNPDKSGGISLSVNYAVNGALLLMSLYWLR